MATATLEIFRAGRHVASSGESFNVQARDLDDVVSTYDPSFHEAPLCIGHPKANDEPAFGWAQRVRRSGDVLEADFSDVDERLAGVIEARGYTRVSPSFYAPRGATNPTPGRWHLRLVAVLGLDKPPIHGLRDVAFAECARRVRRAVDRGAVAFDFAEIQLRRAHGAASFHEHRRADFDEHRVARCARSFQDDMLKAGKFISTIDAVKTVLRSQGHRG